MALMLLVGTSSAWAANSDYYLRGGFNDWNTNNRFDANGTCTISLPANTTYEFKIAKSDWGKEFTYTTKTITATSNNLSLSTTGSNAKITTNAAGSYVFTFSETGKTLSVTYPASCSPATSITSAELQNDGTISLVGDFTTCGKQYHGFQWRIKGQEWCPENDPQSYSGYRTKNSDVDGEDNDTFTPTPGNTYEFRTYIYGTPWIYSTETIEVSTCIELPDDAYALSSTSAEWTGSDITPTISKKDENYPTPTITYNGGSSLPNKSGEYTIKATVSGDATYCNKEFDLGTFTITCPTIAAPAITTSATVCEGTKVTLSSYNGDNTNTVKWYSSQEFNSEVTEQVTLTDDKEYYAKAYHEASGCYSSEYSTLTFTVNPLPTISIGDNTNAVKFEDVKLTATGNNIYDVTWTADKVTITEDTTDPKKAVLTYDQAGTVTVTATATSEAGCTSTAATKTVTFGEENCSTGKTKIRFRKTYNNNEYYGFNTGSVYLYSWNSETGSTYTGAYPGTEITSTETIDGTEYYVYEFTEAQSTQDLNIIVRAAYDWCSNNYCEIGKTRDIALDVPGATYTLELANGSTNKVKQNETEHKKGDNNTNYDVYLFDVDKKSSGGGITITVPAVKTVSVTSDEDGNVTMVGQVVKTGCDTQAILGLQYKKRKQDGTYDDNYTTYPNPGTKEAISAGKTFTVTTKLEDGTYKVRARIDNSHATNGYGEDIIVVVNTVKTPITSVVLTHVKNQAGDSYNDQELANLIYCVGETVWFKLEQNGSKFQDYQWISCPGTDLVGMYAAGTFSFTITDSGNVGIRLRNEENVDGEGNPTWVESNSLVFNTHSEPTAPYISIDPASGVLCEGNTATITVTNPSTDCAYKLVEEGSKAGFTPYTSGDLKYTVQNEGKYYVVAQHNDCINNEYTSNQVAINQIIRTSATISIDPYEAVTTPWEPVTITVIPEEGYVYELSYTDNNLAGVAGVIIKQNGDSYTYYIPRPDSWGTGDSNPVRTPINYGIKAQLKVDGEASQCDLNAATATIQLKDEDNENCHQYQEP